MDNNEDDYVDAKTVKEGKATVFLPPTVFYNPVQEFNRDLTIAVISQFSRDMIAFSHPLKSEKTKAISETSVVNLNSAIDSTIKTEEGHCDGLEMDISTTILSNDNVENSTTETESVAANTDLLTNGERHGTGELRILEALAASGLRSVRFALEIPDVKEIITNDYDRTAVKYIKKNAKMNGVEGLIHPSCADASILMYGSRSRSNRFHVVDLDPYGSASPFLDGAVQCVQDGGLLCVTCTDMAVLCGNATETCHAKYGSTSLHAKFCHEMALRILLRTIDSHANRYSRYIVPLLSLSVDFYCRVFVRVYYGQAKVKDSAAKLAHVYQCVGCGTFALQPLVTKTPSSTGRLSYSVATGPPVDSRCVHCGGRHAIGGPIWTAPLHDVDFVQRVIDNISPKGEKRFETQARILGVLSVVTEELQDQPLYFDMDDLCRIVHCTAVGFLPLRSAILNAGYRVSLSHASKKSLKTNAPAHVIWDIMRCWVRTHPVSIERLQEGSTAKCLLSKSPTIEADFTLHPDANPASRQKGLVRWQLNPESDWGPKPRATRNITTAIDGSIVIRNDVLDKHRVPKRKAEKLLKDQTRSFKKFACKKFERGDCNMGLDCRYAHDVTQTASHHSTCVSIQSSIRPTTDDTQSPDTNTLKDV